MSMHFCPRRWTFGGKFEIHRNNEVFALSLDSAVRRIPGNLLTIIYSFNQQRRL